MEYNFREIEKKWQQYWKDNQTYKVTEKEEKKKQAEKVKSKY